MNRDDNRKNLTNGISFFTEGELFKKKENVYLLQVFALSALLFFLLMNVIPAADPAILYILSLISSTLIVNGYNKVKNENKE